MFLYGSLFFDLWYEHRPNVLLCNEQFSIARGLGHRVKSLGTKEAQERILKTMWDVYEKGRGRIQAWEFDY